MILHDLTDGVANLKSAGTVSPVFSSTMSPGTISMVAIVIFSLLRTTEAVGELRLFKESMVFSALNSCLLREHQLATRLERNSVTQYLPKANDNVEDDDRSDNTALNPGLNTKTHGHGHDEHLTASGSAISPRKWRRGRRY